MRRRTRLSILCGMPTTRARLRPMNKTAIEKAKKRLDKARVSLNRMQSSMNFDEFESAWSDFLLAANSVHSILEYGARNSPQSRQWYGTKKNQRRKDPLLSYLHQARNVDEHGIAPVAKRNPGGIRVGGGSFSEIDQVAIDMGLMSKDALPASGNFPPILAIPSHIFLVTVTDDRFGDSFPPPEEHLGTPLSDKSPNGVAAAGLAYLERLYDEACKLAQP